jgi:hypothetical protein
MMKPFLDEIGNFGTDCGVIVATDVCAKAAGGDGNGERMAFVYDDRYVLTVVQQRGELVLPKKALIGGEGVREERTIVPRTRFSLIQRCGWSRLPKP